MHTGHVVDGRNGRPRRRGALHAEAGDDGRRSGGPSVPVPREAPDAALLQEDPVRGAQAQRREAAAHEGPVREAQLAAAAAEAPAAAAAAEAAAAGDAASRGHDARAASGRARALPFLRLVAHCKA